MYKLGKLPARPEAIKLKLASFGAALPTPPESYGHYALVAPDWQVLGNDKYGDCVWAGAAHEHMLWNKEAGVDVNFTEQSVLTSYTAVTGFDPNDPMSDQGTDMAVAADYRRKTGILDAQNVRHTIGAYLAIEAQNALQLKQAISTFSAVGIGILVPDTAQEQFSKNEPWTIVEGATIEGGHYVPAVGYDSDYLYVVTWGKVQRMTWDFFAQYNDEAIAYLDPEMLVNGKSIDGFDLAALQQTLSEL